MLTTEVKTNVIIFHDKSKKMITNTQAQIIFKESGTEKKSILIDGSLITFSSISKVLTLEEFYNEYPTEKPNIVPEWKETATDYRPLSDVASGNPKWLKGLIKGLKQYITENPESPKAMEMLKKFVTTYRQRYGELK
jgi:hypothetical protein